MKSLNLIILVALFLTYSFTNIDDEKLSTARIIAGDFGSQLKSELVKGMKDGGPQAAIEVCYSKAPQIAETLSDSTGWKVGRTSLKIRNTNNSPDSWEIVVLENFEKRLQEGEDAEKMEFSEIVKIDSAEYFRYMKAIPTGSVCLNCHGVNIKDPIKEKISELYKNDKAVGYKKGEIRGAFTLSKKLN